MPINPVTLTQDLVRCPSVTPEEGGAHVLLEEMLSVAGFETTRVDRGGVCNLFARWGTQGPVLGFNGHTDVVPVGDPAAWTHPPFSAQIVDGTLFGRGASDMKSGVAAWVAAAIDFVTNTPPQGSLIITITGDEEGVAEHGTVALLDWMANHSQKMDHCLVGEPTCPATMGEMMKIGRRGSLTAYFTAKGVQGHVAYPHRAKNPLPALMRLLDGFASHELDQGTEHFDPSTLAITTVDVGNSATNLVPAQANATMNIRFNDAHSPDSLSDWIRAEVARISAEFNTEITCDIRVSGVSFITPPGDFSELIAGAVQAETGVKPVMSTSGGTSDARFVQAHCPVVEFGLVGATMHKVDECVEVAHIDELKRIYQRIMHGYFAKA